MGKKKTAAVAVAAAPVDFPRGGSQSQTLTSLELRDVNEKAAKDLFANDDSEETPSKKHKKRPAKEDGKDAKKRKKNADSDLNESGSSDKSKAEKSDTIAALTFKKLNPGFTLLGVIKEINDLELIVSLPNQMTGAVSITEISQEITDLVERVAANEDGDDEAEQESSLPSLNHLFKIGQSLPVLAITTEKAQDQAAKRKIELSIKPERINSTINVDEIRAGMTLSASVKSHEDNGYILSFGFKDSATHGFLHKKHAAAFIKSFDSAEKTTLAVGQVFYVSVLSMDDSKRTIGVPTSHNLSFASLKPGLLIPSRVKTAVDGSGIIVSFMGLFEGNIELGHLGEKAGDGMDLAKNFKSGMKVQPRILYVDTLRKKVGFTLLNSLISWTTEKSTAQLRSVEIGTVFEDAKISRVDGELGMAMTLKNGLKGFVHATRLSDKEGAKIDGGAKHAPGTTHKTRVVGYDVCDDLLQLSMKPSVLNATFLRRSDVKAGMVVKGTVTKVEGYGVMVSLADGISGLVPKSHLAENAVLNPGKMFKLGSTVKCRVLSVNAEKRRIALTFKKPLINSQLPIITSLDPSNVGVISEGSIMSVLPFGCLVSFYNDIKALVPLRELSHSFVTDPKSIFNPGQVVQCKIISVDAPANRMIASIKGAIDAGSALSSSSALKSAKLVKLGEISQAKVLALLQDSALVEMMPSGARAILSKEHLTDHPSHVEAMFSSLQKDDVLNAVLVIQVDEVKDRVTVSAKPALLDQQKANPTNNRFKAGDVMYGYVKSCTETKCFVWLKAGVTGVAKLVNLSDGFVKSAGDVYKAGQTVAAIVVALDANDTTKFDGFASQRLIALVNPSSVTETQKKNKTSDVGRLIADAVDPTLMSLDDLTYGVVVKGKIQSIRPSQLNILLGSNLKGRVHISEVAETFKEIENVKHPLSKFKVDQILSFKVVGFHQEGKSSKFLAITHKNPTSKTVVELTLRKADLTIEANELAAPLNVRYPTIASIEEGSIHLAFVQAVTDKGITVSIGSQLNGRVTALEASNDLSIVKNLSKSFKEGMAVNVMVLSKNVEKWMLNLSIRAAASTGSALMKYPLSIATAQPGFKCVGVVTGVVPNKGLKVSIADKCYGTASLFEISDDTPADPTNAYKEGDYVACRVYKVDASSKTIHVTLRASRVNNKDTAASTKIEENAIVKGYVKSVSDSGIFVDVGYGYIGRVQIKEVSDDYVKDWKSLVEVGDVVTARTLSVDQSNKKVDLSMKKTAIDPSYTHVRKTKGGSASSSSASSMSITDLEEGMKLTGTVTSIHEYGVFIKIDDTNLKGLCHSSELSDKPISMISSLYSIGDPVLAYVLKVDLEKKRINFGLKASYFSDSMEVEEADEEEDAGDDDAENDDGFEDVEEGDEDSDEEMEEDNDEEVRATKRGPAPVKELAPLSLGGSGWGGDDDSDEELQEAAESDSGEETTNNESKKSRRAKKRAKLEEEERVAQKEQELLEVKAPDSSEAFERILMGSPNSSFLWIKFMAFHLQMAEIGKAREVGERALKSISFREPQELSNIWVALLNLENTYGDRESLMKVFERAVSFNEPKAMYLNLAGIYERSENFDELDPLFQIIVKRFKESCKVWVAYGLSLLKRGKVAESRKILERSMKSLAKRKHLKVVCKFAQMEFKHGEPERGRTLFEGIVSNHPKRLDMWSVYLDMETRAGDVAHTRRLFERAISLKLSSKKMKFLFKKYLEFEKSKGSPEGVKHVKEAAMEYVERISS
ncbi:hypothetical protein BJ741DRAFT_534156 [Chytriomyces cf. hyalinus JEL632]|nr:hypothetical protein BJ741DRAFT_534156 [Chytriomyces cf. hyalinus JEL632]